MKKDIYTIEQIKKAFFEIFHESGELWFNYLGTPGRNLSSTLSYWNDFVDALGGAEADNSEMVCPNYHKFLQAQGYNYCSYCKTKFQASDGG